MRLRSAFFALILVVSAPFAASGVAATEIERIVSPGGIEAWLVEERAIPILAVSFAFVGGASQDPDGRAGVANMISGLLDEGAGDLDSLAFQSALDEFSIELSFDATRDAFLGSLVSLTENRGEAVRLTRLALTEPRFDVEPVERIRDQIISSIRSDERNPNGVASKALMRAMFPDHPYGNPSDGTLDSVAAITVDDLRRFHADTFAQDNLKIAVVGDIDAATLGPLLDEMFGGLPATSKLADVADVAPAGGQAIEVPMAIPQTIIRAAGKGLKRDDEEFIAASVAAYILGGGGFSSRLYEEVREKRGLAYSVYLGLIPLDSAGAIYVGTSTRADQVEEVLTLIVDEIARFAAEGPTEEELADAKSYMIGSYPLRFGSSTAIADQLVAIQLDDLGIDYIDRRKGLIEAVSIDDVRRVAKRLFGQDDLIIVRVGQPAS